MFYKVLKSVLLFLLVILSIYIGYIVATNIYDLLDFQVVIYKHLLQTQESILGAYGQVKGGLMQAADFLGLSEDYVKPGKNELLTDQGIELYASKLRIISNIIGGIIGILVFKIGFDILFGLKKIVQRIVEFVTK